MPPTHAGPSFVSAVSLYRTYIREIRKLPPDYLRLFFRIKASDDVRAVVETDKDKLRFSKFRRMETELHKLQAANGGDHKAWAHILDTATGRKGKLRWELMQPLLANPNSPLPPRIIDAVESSRPPVYSPELTALVTSDHSRYPKAVKQQHLSHPYTLPDRARPNSEDARLLGPFSKRREVNIRWRFFTAAWRKVLPPLQITAVEKSTNWEHPRTSTSRDELATAGVRSMGLQDTGMLEQIVAIAGPESRSPVLTRKQRKQHIGCGVHPLVDPPQSSVPKFIRRMHGSLLSRIPVLEYTFQKQDGKLLNEKARYGVTISPNAIIGAVRHPRTRLPQADDVDLAWFPVADIDHSKTRKKDHCYI